MRRLYATQTCTKASHNRLIRSTEQYPFAHAFYVNLSVCSRMRNKLSISIQNSSNTVQADIVYSMMWEVDPHQGFRYCWIHHYSRY